MGHESSSHRCWIKKLGRLIRQAKLLDKLSVSSLYEDGDLTKLTASASAVEKAYKDAEDAKDIECRSHDCFAVTEVMMYGGWLLVKVKVAIIASGETGINGTIPVNTGGGDWFWTSVGATGVKQALEVYRQMKENVAIIRFQINQNTGLQLTWAVR